MDTKSRFCGGARYDAVGFTIGNKGYIGTGKIPNVVLNDFWEYDPISNTWTQKANFGGSARRGAVGFSIGNKGYIGSGATMLACCNDFWEYDPSTDSWLQKLSFPGVARAWAVGFAIGSKGYFGTGDDTSPFPLGHHDDFWEFDPNANLWNQKANFGGGKRHAAVGFGLNGKGYIGTGNFSQYYDDFWEYDVIQDTWTKKNTYGGGNVWSAVGFSTGSRGYIGLGLNSFSGDEKEMWEFNPFKFDFSVNSDSICLGSSVTFTNITNDPEAYFHELWFMTPGYADTVVLIDTLSTTLQWLYDSLPGVHHVQIFVSDSNGVALGGSEVHILVSAINPVSFAVAPAGCNSFDGTAAVSSSGGVAPYSYQWSTNSSMQAVSGLAAGNYSVTITDDIGCTATASVSVGTSSVVPTPTICMVTVDSLSQNNVIMWDKTSYQHVDSFIVYREVGLNNYQPIASIPYDSMSLFVDTVRTKYFPNTGDPNAGTYKYKLQIRDSCGGLSPLSQDHNTIFIINSSGTFSWPQLYLVGGATNPVNNYILMRDNTSNGNWTVVNSVAGSQQTVTDPQYATYQSTASWRVETQWSISCTPAKINPEVLGFNASRSNIFSFVNGVDEFYNNPQISISPNPFVETATLHIQNGGSMSYEFKMLDIYGREVMTHIIPKGMDDFKIERNSLACGMYFYKLANGNAIVASGKLIIE